MFEYDTQYTFQRTVTVPVVGSSWDEVIDKSRKLSLHTNVHAPRTSLYGRIQIGHKSGF